MATVIWLLLVQGILGAFDTLYFHEWKARLPARGRSASLELRLHAARDFIYAIIFASLPWFAWQGWWAAVMGGLLLAEVAITLSDFVIEDVVRRPIGGVYPGERITHALMGIVYGAMLAYLVPTLCNWWALEAKLAISLVDVPDPLIWLMALMAVGVFLSGLRDMAASYELPGSSWPWKL